MAKKYYSILGVAEDATEQEIKRAFRGIARECHPDVAGDNPVAASRFKEVRQAYEVLVNPEKRAKYDRKGQRLGGKGESFFKAFYRATGKSSQFQGDSQGTSGSQSKELNLDDLFAQPSGQRSSPPKQPSSPPPPPPSAIEPDEPGDMTQGEHVNISLDVPGEVAKTGGTVTVNYQRLQRSTAWRPGATDAGLIHVNDFADVRIIPGTRDGQRLREPGLGNAGPHGGAFGDLIARVRVVGQAGPSPSIHENVNRHMSSNSDMDDVVDITIVEAILGGRITVATPQGETRLAIPSGTSSHGRFRLKGRGEVRLDGTPKDYYVGIRVVVPETLDKESRILIEEFAKLNPDEPRK